MDRNEFANKIMKYKNNMFRFAMSYMHSESEAKDVVQDVLMKLWETRNELEEKKNLEAWCMTLTRNKSLDALKRAGRKMTSSLDLTHHNPGSENSSPLQAYSDKESMNHIKNALGNLPEKQVATFMLRDMQGYSYLEIGEMLGLSIDQVKVNIHRARKALKKELSKVYAYGN